MKKRIEIISVQDNKFYEMFRICIIREKFSNMDVTMIYQFIKRSLDLFQSLFKILV